MTPPVVAAFSLEGVLTLLLWGAWVFLNLSIWQKAKSSGHLVMLVGSGLLAVGTLFEIVSSGTSYATVTLLGLVVMTIGFYVSVRPLVATQVASLQAKLKQVFGGKPGGGDAGSGPAAPPA